MSSLVGSPLATLRNVKTTQMNIPRNKPITKLTIHHAAGVISGANLQGWGRSPSCGASWHYGVGNDGVIGQLTDERNRPWTSSSGVNDNQAITFEIGNSTTAPNWEIGTVAWNVMIELLVCCVRRNPGIKRKDGRPGLYFDNTPNASLTFHDMFAKTTCPGPFIRSRAAQHICDVVNARIDGTIIIAPPQVPPTVATPPVINNTGSIKIGDIVDFNGGPHFVSANATGDGVTMRAGKARVTNISLNSKYPFHLVGSQGGAGTANSNVWGWVATNTIKTAAAPVPPPQHTPPTFTNIQVGSKGDHVTDKIAVVGSKVKIKACAGMYSRTTTMIPARFKGIPYTVQQVATADVLIKELVSWVKRTDIEVL